MTVKPYMQRIAELWVMQTNKNGRGLNTIEAREWNHCLNLLVKDMYEYGNLFNLSLAASMANDKEWQFEICRRIDNANL